jgi:hypothetical protein
MPEEILQDILDAITTFFAGAFATLLSGIENIFHVVVDFFIAIIYFITYIFGIFHNLFTPIQFIFYFLKDVLAGFTDTITNATPIAFGSDVLNILNAIPNFTILTSIVGGILIVLLVFGSLKYLSN